MKYGLMIVLLMLTSVVMAGKTIYLANNFTEVLHLKYKKCDTNRHDLEHCASWSGENALDLQVGEIRSIHLPTYWACNLATACLTGTNYTTDGLSEGETLKVWNADNGAVIYDNSILSMCSRKVGTENSAAPEDIVDVLAFYVSDTITSVAQANFSNLAGGQVSCLHQPLA